MSSSDGELGIFLKLQQKSQTSLHLVKGNSGFHSSHCRRISTYLELRGNSVSFQLVMGITGLLSSCDADLGIPLGWQQWSQDSSQVKVGEVVFPLELQQGSRASSQVEAKPQGSSLVVAGNSGFLQELQQGTESSSQSAVINQCSSGFAARDAGLHWSCGRDVGVLLELGWYSGFLVTCSGASYRVLLG